KADYRTIAGASRDYSCRGLPRHCRQITLCSAAYALERVLRDNGAKRHAQNPWKRVCRLEQLVKLPRSRCAQYYRDLIDREPPKGHKDLAWQASFQGTGRAHGIIAKPFPDLLR